MNPTQIAKQIADLIRQDPIAVSQVREFIPESELVELLIPGLYAKHSQELADAYAAVEKSVNE